VKKKKLTAEPDEANFPLSELERTAIFELEETSRSKAPRLKIQHDAKGSRISPDHPVLAVGNALKDEFGMGSSEEIILYSGADFPCQDSAFDSLFHTEVLEHVFHYRDFLLECRRVLKPEGEMMFIIPFQARFQFAPHDYFRYTPSALRAMLAEARFQDIEIAPRGSDITVAAYKTVAVAFRWVYGGAAGKLLFALTSPLTALLLVFAHLSILWRLGSADDCLGYSVRRGVAAFRLTML
jgi:hypothetical protein